MCPQNKTQPTTPTKKNAFGMRMLEDLLGLA
jgi:hypothetical protein